MRVKEVFDRRPESAEVRGWVYRIRSSGGIVFAVIRDSTGIIQVTVKKERGEAFKNASEASIESSVVVRGRVREDKRAPGGLELEVEDFEIVSLAEKFPIQEDYSEEYLLDIRHIAIRARRYNEIFRIRSATFNALRDFFQSEGYYEAQCPMIVTSMVEGGSAMFELDYFGKKAYLTQSSQFYLEALIYSMEQVYTIAPSFRAEKSRTVRHLTEFWHCEAEAAWVNNEEMMRFEERMIESVTGSVADACEDELKDLGRDTDFLKSIRHPFERMTFSHALKELALGEGGEIGADEEYSLTIKRQKPVFITEFPRGKGFYHRPDPDNPEVLLCHDLLFPEGYGEIIGGGERVWDKEELIERIREFNLDPKDYGWYVDLRRYGSVPHSGFGFGVDRFVRWIAKLNHIRDTIPFPRTINRYYP
jgi:asparaginyl-tRNA synthetase